MYNRGNFHLYSISGCEVKKFFRGDGASMKWPIFERFRALSPPNVVRFCWNLHHSHYSRRVRQCFKNFLKIQIFTEIGHSRSLHFCLVFVQLWGRFSPWRKPISKKLKYVAGQNYAIGLSKNRKIKALSCPNFSGKIDYFLSYFGCFLVKKGAWSHFKGSESKFDLPYCSLTILGHVPVKKVWSQKFPVLRL